METVKASEISNQLWNVPSFLASLSLMYHIITFAVSVFAFSLLFIVINTGFDVARKKKYKLGPEGTKMVPGIDSIFWGNFCLFKNRNRILDFLTEFASKYGQTAKIPTAHLGDIILVAEPDCVEHILKKNFDNYPKGQLLCEYLFDLLGHGIFASDGEQWKSQRKTFSHLFKIQNLKGFMYSTFDEHSEKLNQLLQNYVGDTQGVDLQNLFLKFTFDSIGVIAFGKDLNSLREDSEVLEAFNYAALSTSRRLSNPLWKVTPDANLTKSLQILNEFSFQLIKERRIELDEKEDINKEDILSNYLIHTNSSDEALRDVILNFLIAGRDTTGQTLTWLFYLLSQNPLVEQKLMDEINSWPKESPPSFREFKDTAHCPYLHGVVMETLRLYPPVPFDPKQAKEGDTLPNGYWVPKGSLVFWSAWIMGRLPKYWANPKCCIPERWFPGGEAESVPSYAFIPFQAGPRICLGKDMALLEVKLCVWKVLQKFQLRVVKDQPPIEPIFAVTINSKANSMWFTVEERDKSIRQTL